MKFAGVWLLGARDFNAQKIFKLTATLAVFLFIQLSASVSAQEDAAATHDSHTGLAAAQLDHQHGPATTHEHNVEHMLELMGVPEQVNKAAGDVLKLYSANIDSANTDPNVKSLVDAYQRNASKVVYATLGWPNIKATYISSYAGKMSEQEVEQVTKFLQSPIGKKFIASQIDAGAEIQQTTRHLVEADMAEPLAELGNLLGDGLAKLQAKRNEKE